jgi:predicted nuclease of predicted toxin-antitoxin system
MKTISTSILALTMLIAFVSDTQAQLFPRLRATTTQSCPNGVCPNKGTQTQTQWYNRDGLTPREHVEQVHGLSTAHMSHEDVLRSQNDYHNHYGSGHPAKQSNTILNKIASSTYTCSGTKSSCAGSTVLSVQTTPTVVYLETATVSTQQVAAQQVEALANINSLAERRKCIKAVMQAARQSRDDGKITSFDVATLSILSRTPASMAKIQAVIHETAIEEGLATATAIDWDALISFIEKLIPLIIKLIGLFGGTNNVSTLGAMTFEFEPSYCLVA